MATLTDQLKRIEDDIIIVLKETKKPLTQEQLYEKSKLENMSYFGWTFALQNLEKKKLIEIIKSDKWRLV